MGKSPGINCLVDFFAPCDRKSGVGDAIHDVAIIGPRRMKWLKGPMIKPPVDAKKEPPRENMRMILFFSRNAENIFGFAQPFQGKAFPLT